MGKRKEKPVRHKLALGDQIEDPGSAGVRTTPRVKKREREMEDEAQDELLPPKLSDQILQEAQAQQLEVEQEQMRFDGAPASLLTGSAALSAALKDEDSSDDDLEEEVAPDGWDKEGGTWEVEEADIPEEDRAILEAFMDPQAAGKKQRSLADLVMEKLQAKQAEQGLPPAEERAAALEIDENVQEIYGGVGQLLSRFTSGKMPRAFKVIPHMRNWEEMLWLTDPESWSPHAVWQATKLFVSNLNAKQTQRFMNLVLLPRVREDIRSNHRLHFALFQALKKATFKPGAFYKGLLLPLCAEGNCTLREAVILSSVLKRVSIPLDHSAAALLRMADMPYCGTTSFFMLVLLEKKYNLPYRVIDGLVDHFLGFVHEERQLPVIWHQTLLRFVQRYKQEIRAEDKERLRQLLKLQHHYQVTPEVYRELDHSRSRGEAPGAGNMAVEQAAKRARRPAVEDPRRLPPVLMEED